MERNDLRFALPSKGVLQEGSLTLLERCGLDIFRPNPRQYEASIPHMPDLKVLFQRPNDVVAGVLRGAMDFGIAGLDVYAEKVFGHEDDVVILHDALGFGPCTLNLAVPEDLAIHTMSDVAEWARALEANGRLLRIATKFPNLTGAMLDRHGVTPYKLIDADGTLEIAPAIGYADMIADLVSSGITLRDNHLRRLDDGQILASQAILFANKSVLQSNPRALDIARQLIEYIEAYVRAEGSYMITANMRGQSPEEIAQKMFAHPHIGGLQGPTVSPIVPPQALAHDDHNWFAVNIIAAKNELFPAIAELRAVGGSGVIVTPITYIFEEEPQRYRQLLNQLQPVSMNGSVPA